MPYKNPEDRKKYQASYYKNWYRENGRKRNTDYSEAILEWQQEHPERVRVAWLLKYAVKTGKIIKPECCEECHREVRLSGHHKDYSEPLKVIWLCSSCHKLKHST